MGLALRRRHRLAIGTTVQVWEFRDVPDVARRLEPAGTHDACFLPRTSHVTGNVQIHEMAYGAGGELWFVNTRFSCLCTLDRRVELRAALAAAVRHRAGAVGPLPPQRPGHGRRPAEVRHRAGRDERAGRLAGEQGAGRPR